MALDTRDITESAVKRLMLSISPNSDYHGVHWPPRLHSASVSDLCLPLLQLRDESRLVPGKEVLGNRFREVLTASWNDTTRFSRRHRHTTLQNTRRTRKAL